MNEFGTVIKTILLAIGGVIGHYYTKNPLIFMLLIASLIDYITGMLGGWYTGTLSSKTGYKGIAKKFGIYVIVGVGAMLDFALKTDSTIQTATILFYLVMEFVSIIENIHGKLGVPVPERLIKGIEVLKSKEKVSEEKEEEK